ncbi:3-oxoacyl-[acyl-carrier-protein] synthase III C-terminal domain-containing protein [Plantactinospora sp. GCM10030261]|uniref:3-oxoacyl-[acyl-carrier-protein] synthase III C-terminal domain-containing protein n=1 Tax=Plantactinospora sp. GCM10030261 TaxID=3273420 RepID=UPI00360B379E
MTALEAVSSYLPPEATPVARILADLDFSAAQIGLYQRYYGFAEVRREPGAGVAELLLAAASKLDQLRGREDQVRYLVYAPTIQLATPYPADVLDRVRDALGLTRAAAFSLTQHACASALLAVDVCGKLLAADDDPDGLALVLAGEKTFTRVTKVMPNSAVMGEATAAVLVRPGGGRDRVVGYATRTHSDFHVAPFEPPELAARFDELYPAALAEVIEAALAASGLTAPDLALVLPHNVNKMSWYRVARSIGLPVGRILLDNVPVLGHCFGADPFINYQTAQHLGRLRPGDHYLMTSVGLGATFSAMVFRR